MDNNVIIALVIVCCASIGYFVYSKYKALPTSVEETKEVILKDFLQIFIVIAKDCMDILTISNDGKKLSISEDEYKELLAKKIVEVFDRDVHYDKIIFSEEDKIAFVKNYVLSADDIIEKLKSYFEKDEKEIVDEAGATETLTSDASVTIDPTKTNMIDGINDFYDKE